MSQTAIGLDKTLLDDPLALVRKIAAQATSPLSGKFRRCVTFSDYDLVRSMFRQSDYTCWKELRHDYLCSEILSKYVSSDGDKASLDIPTYQKFTEIENHLSSVNNWLTDSNSTHEFKSAGESAISLARLKILRLLGSQCPLIELEDACSFSSGASFLKTRRKGSSPSHKFDMSRPDVTLACADLAWYMITRSPGWSKHVDSLTLVAGNKLTTVPKNRKVNRTIAIEPTMNMYIQKGIGAILRSRLRLVGIDLNSQSRNQQLAREGSLNGVLATIDLSSASDSISLSLVRLLLPPDWYHLLLMARSDVGVLPDGSLVEYEKISSMGNGYTFELESLIFWAIATSVVDSDDVVSVYGDDIIIPSRHVSALQSVFSYCGFTLNKEKSFWTGLFRESCGKHYYHGIDVTPTYHRKNGSSDITIDQQFILLANNLRRLIGVNYEVEYQVVHSFVLQHISESWRNPRIPDGVGDGALIGTLAEVLPKFRYRRLIDRGISTLVGPCYSAKVLINVVADDPTNLEGSFLSKLHELSTREPSSTDYTIRNKLTSREFSLKSVSSKYRIGKIRLWSWSDPLY